MKYLIAGIILGVLGSTITVAMARNGMELVDTLTDGVPGEIYKVYDSNNQTVCYAYQITGYTAAISCLK